jgi:hypothetical protein
MGGNAHIDATKRRKGKKIRKSEWYIKKRAMKKRTK